MKKLICFILILCLALSACPVFSSDEDVITVLWSAQELAGGDLSVEVWGAEDGLWAILALYSDGALCKTARVKTENSSARITVSADGSEDCAKLFLWNTELSPAARVLSVLTPSGAEYIGGTKYTQPDETVEIMVSDDQLVNKPSSVAYHTFDAITGEYKISFSLTVLKNGDNAVMLGDSANGALAYNTSSAILLMTGGSFSVRNGDGKGGYSDTAAALCDAVEGETYAAIFEGSVSTNTYTVSITDSEGKTYTSGEVAARLNASSLDTIAFISNGHSTVVSSDGKYSDYYFCAADFKAEAVEDDPVYEGFAGLYYGIKANGKYIRGNNGKLSADYAEAKDSSAMFLPRYMGDGSYAFLCKSSSRRITAASKNSQLASADYASNDLTQHWYLEESENSTAQQPAYYLKSMYNDCYAGVVNGYMAAVSEENKTELQFVPLYSESPLYLVSLTDAYAALESKQRARIEEIYESVAGDIFGRYGSGDATWTMRTRFDNTFTEILDGTLASFDKQYAALCNLLNSENGYVIENLDTYSPDTALPGKGAYYETDDGTYGYYNFWSTTYLNGTLYKYSIYEDDGTLQQTVNLYVEDNDVAKGNAATFKKTFLLIPYVYRRHVQNVRIRNDNADSYNGGGSDIYIRTKWINESVSNMLGTLIHECGHGIDQNSGVWSTGSGWVAAMSADMYMASKYANSSKAEDFAEFGRLYFLCYGNRDMQKGLQLLFPERYASFYRLRNNRYGGFSLWDDTEYL